MIVITHGSYDRIDEKVYVKDLIEEIGKMYQSKRKPDIILWMCLSSIRNGVLWSSQKILTPGHQISFGLNETDPSTRTNNLSKVYTAMKRNYDDQGKTFHDRIGINQNIINSNADNMNPKFIGYEYFFQLLNTND